MLENIKHKTLQVRVSTAQPCHFVKRALIPQKCFKQSGFTLIEILVAMTIIAVGCGALVASAAASSWRADYLREREFGRWVASNALTELQSVPSWPANGTTNKEVDMGNITWYVRTRTQAVADPDLRRVDIEVRLDKDADNYSYTLTGIIGNPVIRQGVSNDESAVQ